MKGTNPNWIGPERDNWQRFGPFKEKNYHPIVTFRVTGEGWTRAGGRVQKVQDQVFHNERWQRGLVRNNQSGMYINVITKRKNKRDFPEFEPIPVVEERKT